MTVIKKFNREKTHSANSGKFWCNKCDACVVTLGQKCPRCKTPSTSRHVYKHKDNLTKNIEEEIATRSEDD